MKKRTLGNNAGFTLLEVMLAVGILLFAIVALLTGFFYIMAQGTSNKNMVIAVTDAQYVLEKFKDTTYSSLSSYTDTNFTSLSNESVRVTVTTSGNTKYILANVTWLEGRRQKNYALATQISW